MHKFLCLLIKKEIKRYLQFTRQILEKIALQQTFHMILTMIFAKEIYLWSLVFHWRYTEVAVKQ